MAKHDCCASCCCCSHNLVDQLFFLLLWFAASTFCRATLRFAFQFTFSRHFLFGAFKIDFNFDFCFFILLKFYTFFQHCSSRPVCDRDQSANKQRSFDSGSLRFFGLLKSTCNSFSFRFFSVFLPVIFLLPSFFVVIILVVVVVALQSFFMAPSLCWLC